MRHRRRRICGRYKPMPPRTESRARNTKMRSRYWLDSRQARFRSPSRVLEVGPPLMPVGIPSQLLERRPNIAAAERTMAEANALIGVGRAAYFPTVSLSAIGGTQTSAIGSLLTWLARFWSLGGSVSETLLDFGARRATVQQYQAQYDADVATYWQTVLNAFREVEDYLASVRILATQLDEQS